MISDNISCRLSVTYQHSSNTWHDNTRHSSLINHQSLSVFHVSCSTAVFISHKSGWFWVFSPWQPVVEQVLCQDTFYVAEFLCQFHCMLLVVYSSCTLSASCHVTLAMMIAHCHGETIGWPTMVTKGLAKLQPLPWRLCLPGSCSVEQSAAVISHITITDSFPQETEDRAYCLSYSCSN